MMPEILGLSSGVAHTLLTGSIHSAVWKAEPATHQLQCTEETLVFLLHTAGRLLITLFFLGLPGGADSHRLHSPEG